MKIGRFYIGFGEFVGFQSKGPLYIRRWWKFWLFEEINPLRIDKKRAYPLGARASSADRHYRYVKMGKRRSK